MNITASLIGQIAAFVILIWFIKAVLWEPMLKMMEDRKRRIADGLEAAERGQHEQELAEQRAKERLQEAKHEAAEVVGQAQKRAAEIIDEAKDAARHEAERIKAGAQAEIGQELNRAREQLRKQVAELAVLGAARILEREVDARAHSAELEELASQLQ